MTKGKPVITIDALGRQTRYPSVYQAALKLGIKATNVYRVLKGRGETANGLKWRYETR